MEKSDFTYTDWYQIAWDAGFDWENDPPPEEALTEELCIAALDSSDSPRVLSKIPPALRTAEVCYAAVYVDDDALPFVPEHLREEVKARKDAISASEWLRILSGYSEAGPSARCFYIKLTKKLLSPEFLHDMVYMNGQTIRFVPDHLKTGELLALAEERKKEQICEDE